MPRLKLSFCIAGAQKSATSSLHDSLSGHPELSLPKSKELHIFDDDSRENFVDLDDFITEYDSPIRMTGDATPIYLYWPEAPLRMATHNPDMKIIISLRDPVDRAYSHWAMERSRGAENLSFTEAIRSGRARVKANRGGVHRVFSYVERGLYAEQIRRLMSTFPRSSLHFIKFDDIIEKERETLDGICHFLGVSIQRLNFRHIIPTNKGFLPANGKILGKTEANNAKYLRDLFSESIQDTSELTGLDLRSWLND